jgi:type IV pilus assembly protein PilM
VTAAALWRFPPGSAEDPARRREQAIEAVHRLWRRGGFSGHDVLSALPCGQVGIKNVRLPVMPANELHQAVKWEAKERFGFEVADDQLGYIDAGEVRSGTETAREVVLLAVEKKVVEDHLSLLSAMKLSPVTLEADPLAVFRAFERFLRREEDEQAARVVVDVGGSGTRVVVAKGKQIVFLKSIDVGGSAMTSAVAQQFNLSLEDAAQFRLRAIRQEWARSMGEPPAAGETPGDRSAQDAIRGVLESLAEEIALCLRYCSVTFRGLRLSQVILCGGEAYDPFVSKLLGERLGMPVIVGRPLRGLDTSQVNWDADCRGLFAEWAVCAGLAVRHLSASSMATEVDHGPNRLSA